MKWEKRIETSSASSELPLDYLKLVEDTLTGALAPGLTELKKTLPESRFKSGGAIFADEVVLAITLSHGAKHLSATTVYASCNYDPHAELPGLEANLSACLDAVAAVFDFYLDPTSPEKIEQITHHSLGALDEAPFDWTEADPKKEVIKIPVWVKVDKSNLELDLLTEDWLKKNDPDYGKVTSNEEAEEFLEERLEAIKAAKSGSGTMGGGGPITH